jgi:NAD(P)H-flavin reductase
MTVLKPDPMVPRPFRIESVRRDLSDTFTVELKALDGGGFSFTAGQFNMLYVFGVGEIPISISGDPADGSKLVHTTRAVGPVSGALDALKQGDVIGVRGPFGTPWPVDQGFGRDVVFVAGGVGLAPLRPAIYQVLANRQYYGKVVILYGARTPEDVLYDEEVHRWRGRFDMDVLVTVDRATGEWQGNVGVVTTLVAKAGFNPGNTAAFVCGPEVMMRFAAQALEKRGVDRGAIWLSMERNMKCGCGLCGHCQWGPDFVCKDGPVFRYDRIYDRLSVREL